MSESPKLLLYARFPHKSVFDFAVERLPCSVIFILERGSFAYSIGNMPEHVASSHDVICCPPNMPFRRRIIEPVRLHVLRFAEDECELEAGRIELSEALAERISRDLEMLTDAGFMFKQSFSETETHFLLDIRYTLGCLRTPKAHESVQRDSIVESLKTRISQSLCEKLTVSSLAKEYGLTPAALIRRFRRSAGTTPMEFIIAERIDSASHLLAESDLPIGEIAVRCGFENGYYFSNSFKKRCGCSPSDFRRSARL